MNKKKTRIIISVILVLLLFTFVHYYFKNDIKAHKMGIDVKYLNEPKHCKQDSDCRVQGNACSATNIYNFERSGAGCEWDIYGATCDRQVCKLITEPPLEVEK